MYLGTRNALEGQRSMSRRLETRARGRRARNGRGRRGTLAATFSVARERIGPSRARETGRARGRGGERRERRLRTHCFNSGIATPPMMPRARRNGDAIGIVGTGTRAASRYMNFFVLDVAFASSGSSGQKCLGYRPASSRRTAAEAAFKEKCKRDPELMRKRIKAQEKVDAASYAEDMKRQRDEQRKRAAEAREKSAEAPRRRRVRVRDDDEEDALATMARNLEAEEEAATKVKERANGDESDDDGFAGVVKKRKAKRFMF